jgi:putative hydrolase of the HAD superfamily
VGRAGCPRGRLSPPVILTNMRYRAVFFDAGETILHPAPSFPELFADVLAGFGHAVDEDTIRDGLQAIPQRFVQAAERRELWTTSPERSRAFWTSVYDHFLESVELPTGDGLQTALYAAFTDVRNYALFDDVPPTLDLLSRAGFRLGLVSNFESWLDDLLVHLGIRELFDVRVISGVEGVEKPDPAIFELALERGGMRAEEAVYVGDVPALDVAPPRALGMGAVLVDRRGRYPTFEGPRVIDLRDLAQHLLPR